MTPVTLSFVEDFGFGLLGNILAQLCFGGYVVLLYVCGRSFSGLLRSIFEGGCSSLASPRLASWWWSYAAEGFFWRLSLHDGFVVCSLGFLVSG
ncbi:unnamed protein product [Brassica rapa subsp. narinosa]